MSESKNPPDSKPADLDARKAFMERMTWKPGDVEILTAEEVAHRIGVPIEDLEERSRSHQEP